MRLGRDCGGFVRAALGEAFGDTTGIPLTGSAACFTCGVDSFYAQLRGKDATEHLVFVHGFDIGLNDVDRFAKHAQSDLRGRAVVGLAEELAASIQHADDRPSGGLPCVSYVGTEDPGMPGAKAVDTLSGYTYFRVQSIMVADYSNTPL